MFIKGEGEILSIKMVLKPTLEKKASEILPEIEVRLLARALSGDVFESICNKPDIVLCADKTRSLGDLSNEAFFEEPPLLTESCKSESSLSDASFNFDSDRCSENSSPAEEQPDSGKVFILTDIVYRRMSRWIQGNLKKSSKGGFDVQRGSGLFSLQ